MFYNHGHETSCQRLRDAFNCGESSRAAVASERKEGSVDGWASNFLPWKARLVSKKARLAVDDEAVSVSMLMVAAAAGGLRVDTGDGGGV